MKCTLILPSLLAGVAFAANSKLNQYASIADCQADRNIISHASPSEGSCHSIDSRTGALYLVTGSGAAGAQYTGYGTGDCKGDQIGGNLVKGACIGVPGGVHSLFFY